MQTRNQTKNKNVHREILSQKDENEIEEVKDWNDPPDNKRDIEENANINDEDEESGNHKNNNRGLKIKITKDNI